MLSIIERIFFLLPYRLIYLEGARILLIVRGFPFHFLTGNSVDKNTRSHPLNIFLFHRKYWKTKRKSVAFFSSSLKWWRRLIISYVISNSIDMNDFAMVFIWHFYCSLNKIICAAHLKWFFNSQRIKKNYKTFHLDMNCEAFEN